VLGLVVELEVVVEVELAAALEQPLLGLAPLCLFLMF
jgi:hypothetical protein